MRPKPLSCQISPLFYRWPPLSNPCKCLLWKSLKHYWRLSWGQILQQLQRQERESRQSDRHDIVQQPRVSFVGPAKFSAQGKSRNPRDDNEQMASITSGSRQIQRQVETILHFILKINFSANTLNFTEGEISIIGENFALWLKSGQKYFDGKEATVKHRLSSLRRTFSKIIL